MDDEDETSLFFFHVGNAVYSVTEWTKLGFIIEVFIGLFYNFC